MEPLQVVATEFYPKPNSKENFTEEYDLVSHPENPTPVFRRGCNFNFTIRFNRVFDKKFDAVRVSFNFGPKPNVTKGTRAVLKLLVTQTELPKDESYWGLAVTGIIGNDVCLKIHIPYTAPVGIWNCLVHSNIRGECKRNNYTAPNDIYILFNPWCKHDSVYMEKPEEREEYVLNENGKIWCGTFKKPTGKHWIFGQFDDIVLPSAVFLLEKANLAHIDRGSPVLVTRAISAVVNSVDDSGLLEGRWDGQYEDGTSPHAWTGSTTIMDQYLSSGGIPVKYGQCWVYSAAVVTVCRTLGIPCRSVTNYVSAHDTNCSLTVDTYFDIFGNKIENGPDGDCNDSCWNFHVWNDVWMSRPDLPKGYGGWQIIDATPQEKSDNLFRCGPASVKAVKGGEVGYLYDTPFVFSEVNADVVHFLEDTDSEWGFSRSKVNQYHVGRKIVTKKLGPTDDNGDSDLLIVTSIYKNPEGTEAERLAVLNAIKGVPRADLYYKIPLKVKEDVFFDLIDIDTVPFGESFDVIVNIQNNSDDIRNISAALSASTVYYTGGTAHQIKRTPGVFSLQPGEKHAINIHVTPEEYLDKLVEHSLIKIYGVANVKETKQTWSEEDDFTLIKPDMRVEVSEVCKVGEECPVNFSFKNPLSISLTNCNYMMEGPGFKKSQVKCFRDIGPNETINLTESFKAKRVGKRKIVANFNSKQIQGICGRTNIIVQ